MLTPRGVRFHIPKTLLFAQTHSPMVSLSSHFKLDFAPRGSAMLRFCHRWNLLLTLLLLMSLGACKSDSPTAVTTDPMPDFSLLDVNSTSPTYDQQVSPRDNLSHISAWYFGEST